MSLTRSVCLAVSEIAQAVAFGPVENDDRQHGESGGGTLEGTVLAGRYRVAQVVSTGANTVIMDAIDQQNDGQVTVKVVRPEHAQDAEFRRKFHRLAEVSNALSHPNIASVSDWGEIELRGDSTVFWVVEALGGGSLRDLLDRGRLLQPGQALVVGLEACRALDAAHQKGLFHTELTPSKMVFGADRRLRVVDFGMARLLAESAWADASAVPTHVARYASPEQALGLPIDAKTDVYALALVMIEAVTGAVPFDADSTVATLTGRVDKLLPVSADLGSLASVLERAGRPESADRFTAAEFGRALVQAAPGLPKPEPIPILATGTFDTTAMRRPNDPTGGVERPPPVAGLAGVDETGPPTAAVAVAGAAAGVAAAAVVAGGAEHVGGAVATARPEPTDPEPTDPEPPSRSRPMPSRPMPSLRMLQRQMPILTSTSRRLMTRRCLSTRRRPRRTRRRTTRRRPTTRSRRWTRRCPLRWSRTWRPKPFRCRRPTRASLPQRRRCPSPRRMSMPRRAGRSTTKRRAVGGVDPWYS